MRKKTLLILGAGIDQSIGIKKAKRMGLRVICCDINKNSPGFKIADGHEIVSIYDEREMLKFALRLNRKYKLNGVLTLGTDTSFIIAKITSELGLPGPSLKTAFLATDKIEMKKYLLAHKIPVPWFSKVNSLSNLRKITNDFDYNLVIKPADSRGAFGVLKLSKKMNLEWAYHYAKSFSPTNRIIVEKFEEGPQNSTESIIYDDFATTPGFSDRNYKDTKVFLPHLIENGGELPSYLSKSQKSAISSLAEKAAGVIGLNRWTAKGDMVLTKEGPKVIEIATRLSGGFFSSLEIELSTGVDFVEAAINLALGVKPKLERLNPRTAKYICQRYFFLKSGKIKQIKGVENLKNNKFVRYFKIWRKKGDIIPDMTSMHARSGVVIVQGSSRMDSIKKATEAIKAVNFIY